MQDHSEGWPEILRPIHQPLCGPYAAALAAARPLSEVLELGRAMLNRSDRWRGRMHLQELKRLLKALDVGFSPVVAHHDKTLHEAADVLSRDEQYLVFVTGHFLTLLDGRVFDQHHPMGEVVPSCRWRRRRIKYVLRIY